MKLTTSIIFALSLAGCASAQDKQDKPDQELATQFWRLHTLRSTAKEQFIANDNQLAGEIQKILATMQEQCKKKGKELVDKSGLVCELSANSKVEKKK